MEPKGQSETVVEVCGGKGYERGETDKKLYTFSTTIDIDSKQRPLAAIKQCYSTEIKGCMQKMWEPCACLRVGFEHACIGGCVAG